MCRGSRQPGGWWAAATGGSSEPSVMRSILYFMSQRTKTSSALSYALFSLLYRVKFDDGLLFLLRKN